MTTINASGRLTRFEPESDNAAELEAEPQSRVQVLWRQISENYFLVYLAICRKPLALRVLTYTCDAEFAESA
jgi:hypothetical protein